MNKLLLGSVLALAFSATSHAESELVGGIGTGRNESSVVAVDTDNTFYEVAINFNREDESENIATFMAKREAKTTERAGWSLFQVPDGFTGIKKFGVSTSTQVDVCVDWMAENQQLRSCSTIPLVAGNHFLQEYDGMAITAKIDYYTIR